MHEKCFFIEPMPHCASKLGRAVCVQEGPSYRPIVCIKGGSRSGSSHPEGNRTVNRAVTFCDRKKKPQQPTCLRQIINPKCLPLICTTDFLPDKLLLDSIFGKVQGGSVLSNQHPLLTSDAFIIHEGSPSFPKGPLEDWQLEAKSSTYVPTNQEQLHLKLLSVILTQDLSFHAHFI